MKFIAPAGNEVIIACNQTATIGFQECDCVEEGSACITPEDALKRQWIRNLKRQEQRNGH